VTALPTPHSEPQRGFSVGPLRQALKIALAALLAYAIWRGYQNPDLILDYASWRLC
jgi:hypothetical protein